MSEQQPRIVFLDAATFGDISLDLFTDDGWNCTVHRVTNPADTIQRIAGHSVAVTNKVVVDKTILKSAEAENLQLIAVAATGTDIIDKDEAAKRGVTVCNVPGYATQSVAQFTMALILELATHAGKYGNAVKAGEWQETRYHRLRQHRPSRRSNGARLRPGSAHRSTSRKHCADSGRSVASQRIASASRHCLAPLPTHAADKKFNQPTYAVADETDSVPD
jgi:D-isomer specific 2-hydroxyacid dehydrogenase-like protein